AEFSGGMLNSVGLANPGLARVLEEALPWLQQNLRKARVVVNVWGSTWEDFCIVVEGLEGVTGIAALEINLSCPNTSAGGLEFGADPASVTRVISLCRAKTRLPFFATLSPARPDSGGMAVVARDAGADGISVVNTIPGELTDPRGHPRLGNGFGGVRRRARL